MAQIADESAAGEIERVFSFRLLLGLEDPGCFCLQRHHDTHWHSLWFLILVCSEGEALLYARWHVSRGST